MINITYFVHGTTLDNEKGIASGWNDVELSELGIKQAKELKETIQEKKVLVIKEQSVNFFKRIWRWFRNVR